MERCSENLRMYVTGACVRNTTAELELLCLTFEIGFSTRSSSFINQITRESTFSDVIVFVNYLLTIFLFIAPFTVQIIKANI